ncbi:MAG: hypothetical protein SFT94_06565 [Pseudanabaenaceae cyanobacterium bins.68]|nr:hypothetical protein [Pseudanabaenaceae cyanobacterium bins.68]
MSHLTPVQIKQIGQFLDSAIAFTALSEDRDSKQLSLMLQGLKLFLPMFSLEGAEECSKKYYQEGKITLEERKKIAQLMQTKPAKQLLLKSK